MFFGLLIALFIIILDQVSKYIIFTHVLTELPYIAVMPSFNLIKAWNTGVSFSMFDDYGVLGAVCLVLVALLIVAFLLHWLRSEKTGFVQVALGFVIGGAIGNVIDRIRFGAVFDFLDFYVGTYHWPAFNVADSFICIGAFMLIFQELSIKNTIKTIINKLFKKGK